MSVIALILLASPVGPIVAPPVGDAVLAEQRGGFRLPNGIDVALTVQNVTSVNGAVVLNTTFRIDEGKPAVSVYVPRAGERVEGASGTTTSSTTGNMAPPIITYDPRGGLQVVPGAAMPRIALTNGSTAAGGGTPDGLVAVGSNAATDNGTISQTQQGGLRTVTLAGPDLTVTHFGGNAFGSAIANSGSDRAIDTQTVVSMDLRNAGPDVLGSAMLRAGNIATDAMALRGQ